VDAGLLKYNVASKQTQQLTFTIGLINKKLVVPHSTLFLKMSSTMRSRMYLAGSLPTTTIGRRAV